MKKIIITFTAACLATLAVLSCTRSDEDSKLDTSVKNVENIMSDSRLVKYINNNDALVNQITNPKRLLELTSKSNLSTLEKVELAKTMGFSSLGNYIDFVEKQNKLLLPIVKEYNLRDEKQLAKFGMIVADNANSILMRANCARTLKNCIGGAAAGALLAHVGCISADITVVAGIVCHAAVAGVQYFAQDECQNSYEGCVGN